MKSIACLVTLYLLLVCSVDGKTTGQNHSYHLIPSFIRNRFPFFRMNPIASSPGPMTTGAAKLRVRREKKHQQQQHHQVHTDPNGNVIINVYGQPQAPTLIPASMFSGMSEQLRDRLKGIQSSMPPMPTLPPFRMPSMPTMPSSVKVPTRVQVQMGQEMKFPPPPTLPPLPSLPPVRLPETITVHRVEYPAPQLNFQSTTGINPIRLEYVDSKPNGPILLQPIRVQSGPQKKKD